MKVRDGIKFGVGFLIAYDLYLSCCNFDEFIRDMKQAWRNVKRIWKSIQNMFASKARR